MFHYSSAIKRMHPTHRSDRFDHSLNRPHAADARPTCGRRNAADNERHNSFIVLSQMRPTRGRRAADDPADYEPTFIVVS